MKKIFAILLLSFFMVGCEYINIPVEKVTINYVTYTDQNLNEDVLNKIDSLPVLSQEGYDFKGWYFDVDYKLEATIENINQNVILYAKWEVQEFKVTFIGFDGVLLDEQSVGYLEDATEPIVNNVNGYKFIGWDKSFTSIKSDMEITALFEEEKYTVNFYDYNGVLLAAFEVNYGDQLPVVSEPTRQYYNFIGWNTDAQFVTENMMIVAVYEYNKIQIIFDTVGGNNINPLAINKGEVMNLPIPIKSGHTFFKWIDDDNYEVIDKTTYLYEDSITLRAVWLENYKSSGNEVNYLYSQKHLKVTMPTEYVRRDEDFRGVWVSHIVNDISRYSSKEQMMSQLTAVLDNMESWNMNALIYHVRTHNDAYYPSENNPMSSYVSAANFNDWDYLEWLISESHKRGIEFHAWMNPYRVSSGTNVTTITNNYRNYPNNPASDAKYLLTGSSTIFNPGEPYVREFLIDTVMEFIGKYDIDAIHFDDYFYIAGVNDTATYTKYKGSFTNLADWRRGQVDTFIKDLSDTMRQYNIENNRSVELGISPSGIYRNGSGVVTYDSNNTAISNGSSTGGMEHYGEYLYSDSKKWIDEEWIDYIVPQSYWGFTHPTAGYANVIDWWAKVVKYKNVKLYAGMGIYMEQNSWVTNPYEASDQVLYNSKLPEVDGTVIFRYGFILRKLTTPGVIRLFNEYWNEKVKTPE